MATRRSLTSWGRTSDWLPISRRFGLPSSAVARLTTVCPHRGSRNRRFRAAILTHTCPDRDPGNRSLHTTGLTAEFLPSGPRRRSMRAAAPCPGGCRLFADGTGTRIDLSMGVRSVPPSVPFSICGNHPDIPRLCTLAPRVATRSNARLSSFASSLLQQRLFFNTDRRETAGCG